MDDLINNLIETLKFEKRYYNRTFDISNESSLNSIEDINQLIDECNRCELFRTIHNKVHGAGNSNADLMIIGEAPGRNEDLEGKPFVGRAGEKLTKMLEYIGIKREDVYISNVLKCRPPDNADPIPEWIEKCRFFLENEIKIIKPKYILALGRFASRFLIGGEKRMGEMRGKIYDYNGIIVLATYHPSTLLFAKGSRLEKYRKDIAEDMKKLKSIIEEN